MTAERPTHAALALPRGVWYLIAVALVLTGVAFAALAVSLGYLAELVTDAVAVTEQAQQQAADQRAELARDLAEANAALNAERAEDDIELQQDRCEDAHRRRVERAEAVTLTVLAEALAVVGTPELADVRGRFSDTVVVLAAASAAQDAYVRNGRQLPCPIEGG